MSAKKIKSILFYLIPLGILFSYIFTTCYGVEIDEMDNRLRTVETDLKAIQEKIASGKVIESVDYITGGFRIKFTDNTSYDIVNGAQGVAGTNGTEWIILDSLWYDNTNKRYPDPPVRALPRDGVNGINAKAPTISDDGYWTFHTWDPEKGVYVDSTTKMMADTAMMYLVDFGDYYELYTPLKNEDGSWKIDPDTGGKWHMIKLPKWKPEPEPALVFKFIGYATVVKGDTVVKMLTSDLDLQYTFLDYVHYNTTRVAEDSALWKWKRRGAGELEEGKFHIARLLSGDSLAVVFSINKPREYMESSNFNFQLKDTRNNALEAIRMDRPVLFDGRGMITKAGTYDTLYFARMRNADPWLTSVPASLQSGGMQSGNTYYRLVMNDTVRSELSPYPLRISQLPALDRAWVESVNPFSVGMPVTAPFGTYDLPNNTSETYHLGFTNQGNLFDHYIAKTETTKIILSQYSAADTIIKRFRVDTLLPASGDEYKFPLIVYTLQKDGVIFMDTIWIKTVQP